MVVFGNLRFLKSLKSLDWKVEKAQKHGFLTVFKLFAKKTDFLRFGWPIFEKIQIFYSKIPRKSSRNQKNKLFKNDIKKAQKRALAHPGGEVVFSNFIKISKKRRFFTPFYIKFRLKPPLKIKNTFFIKNYSFLKKFDFLTV